jgi:hypothetical protein
MPSMNDLAHHKMNQQFAMMSGGMAPQAGGMVPQRTAAPQQQQAHSTTASWDPFAPSTTAAPTANGNGNTGASSAMSDIASAFALDNKPPGGNDFASQFGGLSMGNGGAPLQPQTTGFLQPQRTGYGGSNVKPFKPTSSFGSSLMETLPPIPEPSPTTPGASNGLSAQATGFPGFNAGAGAQTSQSPPPFGGANGVGGTATGSSPFGSAPFGGASSLARSNTFAPPNFSSQQPFGTTPSAGTGASAGGDLARSNTLSPSLTGQPTGFHPTSSFGQNLVAQNPAPLQAQTTGSNPFRASMMFGAGGGGMGMNPQPTGAPQGQGPSPFGAAFNPQQKQQAQASLFL